MLGQCAVDLRKDAWDIAVDMKNAVGALLVGKAEGRDGMAPKGHAGLEILKQLVADILTNIGLGFFGRAADMGGKNNVGEALEGGSEPVTVLFGLPGVDVDGGAGEGTILKGFGQGFKIDHFTTGVV